MQSLQTQLAVLLLSTLGLLTGIHGQKGTASSPELLLNNPAQHRLAQIREHAKQAVPADDQTQPSPTRFDRRSRDRAPHGVSPDSGRLPGAGGAAERYVFGRMDLATDDYPQGVAIGAFQTGGPKSIAVVNGDSATVSILLGNRDGTFQAKTDYAVGGAPYGIAVGDFNGDGNLDLAVSAYSAVVSILLGNGDGTFQPQVQYSCIETCTDVAVGDFNRDGKLDLALDSYEIGRAHV